MNETLEYLRKFRPGIDMVTVNAEDPLQKERLSVRWLEILTEPDPALQKEKIIALWKVACENEFVRVIDYMTVCLDAVYLLSYENEFLLSYAIRNKAGIVYYYEGRFPDLSKRDAYLQANWHRLPTGLQRFYETLHNGFYYSSSGYMGLTPLQNLLNMGSREWDILEDMDEPLRINLSTSYGFFRNGMGDYLVLDVEKGPDEDQAVLWYAHEEPEYELNFWEVVDEWTVLGIEE